MGEDEEEEEEEEEEVEKVFSHSYVWYFSFMCVTFPRTPCLNPTRLLITRSSLPQNTVTPHVHFYFRYTDIYVVLRILMQAHEDHDWNRIKQPKPEIELNNLNLK